MNLMKINTQYFLKVRTLSKMAPETIMMRQGPYFLMDSLMSNPHFQDIDIIQRKSEEQHQCKIKSE